MKRPRCSELPVKGRIQAQWRLRLVNCLQECDFLADSWESTKSKRILLGPGEKPEQALERDRVPELQTEAGEGPRTCIYLRVTGSNAGWQISTESYCHLLHDLNPFATVHIATGSPSGQAGTDRS